MSGAQLPLQLRFPSERRFDSFEPADGEAVCALRGAAECRGQRVSICGPAGSGKTHLLQAACAHAAQHGARFAYLPLPLLQPHAADALDAQTAIDLLCIDGLDAVAGDSGAERALFALANRQLDAGGSVAYAARSAPESLPIGLPDLRSRLQHCTRLMLQPLDETQRRALLKRQAAARGLQLDDVVLDYLFRRVGRDLGTLAALLERIDRESLAAQRRVTVPFVRALLQR